MREAASYIVIRSAARESQQRGHHLQTKHHVTDQLLRIQAKGTLSFPGELRVHPSHAGKIGTNIKASQ